MAENFNSAENQGAALVSLSGSAGDTVTVKNSDGETLASAVSDKNYQCVVVSCAGMTENGTFTLTNGTDSKEFTLSGFIYGESGMGGMNGGGQPGGMNGGQPGDREMPTGENGEPPEMPSGENGGRSQAPNGDAGVEPPAGEDGRPEQPSNAA